jgi:hydroxymethylbilane synthase
VRIGTRGSALALAQAQPVADALGGELVVITTSGDRDRAAGDKGRWVAEIEQALLAGEIDLAVHSAKDVPAELADGLVLLPSPERSDARDALCGARSLSDVGEGGRVGTSSLRREAQLRALRPDLDVVELRGNVDTRLRRLADGDFDAIVVAMAGLQRLGRGSDGVPLDELVPAAGQGTLALEARADDAETAGAVTKVSHSGTFVTLAAERALVRALDADCHTPVGAHAEPVDGGLRLRAFVGRPDGSQWLTDELEGPDPEPLGDAVAQRLLAAGAAEVLDR